MTTSDTRPCVDVDSEAFKAAWFAYNKWASHFPFTPNPKDTGVKALARALDAYLKAMTDSPALMSAVTDGRVVALIGAAGSVVEFWEEDQHQNLDRPYDDFDRKMATLSNRLSAMQGSTS